MFVSAIIVAGGRGTRLGADRPKQLLEIGGRSMLQWSVSAFDRHRAVNEIVVVVPEGQPVSLDASNKRVELAVGGARRQDSVAAGFAASSAAADVVLVHDAARPFVGADLITRVIDAAAAHGAAVPAHQARDTVKRALAAGAPVIETLPRETIWLAETPQGFRRDVLAEAIRKNGGKDVTDEAMLVERAGYPVHVVEGDERNVKITTADDLELARALTQPGKINREEFRVGSGYDLHRLVDGRKLVLAGIEIPFDKGPLGHSDGDVASHAVCDALFGAAAMGDIGRHFPNTDPRWKDVAGPDFLDQTAAIIRNAGWGIVSVDVTVLLERPKLAPHAQAVREGIARALALDVSAVSVKAKTNEGVDAVGRGEAIAAHAVAMIVKRSQG